MPNDEVKKNVGNKPEKITEMKKEGEVKKEVEHQNVDDKKKELKAAPEVQAELVKDDVQKTAVEETNQPQNTGAKDEQVTQKSEEPLDQPTQNESQMSRQNAGDDLFWKTFDEFTEINVINKENYCNCGNHVFNEDVFNNPDNFDGSMDEFTDGSLDEYESDDDSDEEQESASTSTNI